MQLKFSNLGNVLLTCPNFAKCCRNFTKIADCLTNFLLKCCVWSGAKVCTSCRSWKMLSKRIFLLFSYKISFWYSWERARQKFAKIWCLPGLTFTQPAVERPAAALKAAAECAAFGRPQTQFPKSCAATQGSCQFLANFWQIFGKISLVFGCIGTDLCKQIRVFQNFSKSTRLSCWNLKVGKKFADFATFAKKMLNFHENCWFFQTVFC